MANEYLTVRQAQYLLEKLKQEVVVTIDDALSTTSENPVQNAVITNALNAIQNNPVDVTGSDSVASGTTTTICLSAQYGPGVYLVSAFASFATNSSGRRHIHLATTTSGSALDGWAETTVAASPSQPTAIQVTNIIKRTTTGRWYLRAYHNSGSALNVSGGIRVLKLH